MLTDKEIVLLYREWSESTWAAGFMELPADGSLPRDFLDWVQAREQKRYTDYERDLIERWRRLGERER